MATETGTIHSIELVYKQGKLKRIDLCLLVDGLISPAYQVRSDLKKQVMSYKMNENVYITFTPTKVGGSHTKNILKSITRISDIEIDSNSIEAI